MPSESEASWRRTLAKAAEEAGWLVMSADSPVLPSLGDDPENVLVFVRSASEIMIGGIQDWIVFDHPMNLGVAAASARRPDLPYYGVQSVSARRLASLLLGDLPAHVEAAAVRIDVPGLGEIERRASEDIPQTAPTVPALALYDRGLPQIGASAEWGSDILSFSAHTVLSDGRIRIDLTGKTRPLIYGPYIELPKGRWKVKVQFEAEPDEICYLLFDWGVGDDVARCSTTIARAGAYEIDLEHERSTPGAWEIRVWAERGHFSGAINFLSCTIELIS
jgi:hypothetical protein